MMLKVQKNSLVILVTISTFVRAVLCIISIILGASNLLQVEDLDMLARLKLAREKEEDCMESLVDLGEAEDGDEEAAEDDEDDEYSEVSSRYGGSSF